MMIDSKKEATREPVCRAAKYKREQLAREIMRQSSEILTWTEALKRASAAR